MCNWWKVGQIHRWLQPWAVITTYVMKKILATRKSIMINALQSSFLQLVLEVGFLGDFNTANYRIYTSGKSKWATWLI